MHYYLSLVLFVLCHFLHAQQINNDQVYAKNIKTVILEHSGAPMSIPIIQLGSGEQLLLKFDDLDGDTKNYKYTFELCDYNWQRSSLKPIEYLTPFQDEYITSYKYAVATTQPYVHYQLLFPTEQVYFTRSGNYIIKVFLDSEPDKILFTKRFMVFENAFSIQASVQPSMNVNERSTHQQIITKVYTKQTFVSNPSRNINLVIWQNQRQDNAVTLKPKSINGSELDYGYYDANIFLGSSEFRRFDITDLNAISQFVASNQFINHENHAFLLPDKLKDLHVYVSNPDINGKFLINNRHSINDHDVEADYAWVHFYLPVQMPFMQGSLYVVGGLSDWAFSPSNQMQYNPQKQVYEGALFLKQGVYNYQYMLKGSNQKQATLAYTEGDFFETENDYYLFAYYRPDGELYDRLMGFAKINSISDIKR